MVLADTTMWQQKRENKKNECSGSWRPGDVYRMMVDFGEYGLSVVKQACVEGRRKNAAKKVPHPGIGARSRTAKSRRKKENKHGNVRVRRAVDMLQQHMYLLRVKIRP